MKWPWSGLETAPCAETQADPQERGLPRHPRAWRLHPTLSEDLLGLEKEGETARERERARERAEVGGGGVEVGVEAGLGLSESEGAKKERGQTFE